MSNDYFKSNTSQLNYRLTVTEGDTNSPIVTIEYPLTITFDISRGVSSVASFKVINLSRETRGELFTDNYNAYRGAKYHRNLVFECGYGDSLSVAFRGDILEVNSYRESGSNEIVTEIRCQDLTPNTYICKTYSAGTPIKEIIKDVAFAKGVEIPAVGDFDGAIKYQYTLNGKVRTECGYLTGNSVYFDNGNMYLLKPNECLDNGIPKFTAENMYGTPKRNGGNIIVTSFLHSDIILHQLVEIISRVQPEYNGLMKVIGLKHTGTISGGVKSDAKTELTCLFSSTKQIAQINNPQEMGKETDNESFVYVVGEEQRSVFQKSSIETLLRQLTKQGAKAPLLNNYAYKKVKWKDLIQPNNLTGGEVPKLSHLGNLLTTVIALDEFIGMYFPNKTYAIQSGWRSKANNSSLSNASPNSKHLYGSAIDFTLVGINNQQASAIFDKHWAKFSGNGYFYYMKNSHNIHVQMGQTKGIDLS